MEMLAMRIVCSLVSVTVIFQLELFIILNVNYRNVCSSNRPQLRVLPGSSISASWRVDFRNWQVDYYLQPSLNTTSRKNQQCSTRTNYFKYSFFPYTTVVWNNLPYQLVNSPSVISFKAQGSKLQHIRE